ncbi:MAG: hypothetical protein SFY67_06020 [Candidatus Melainabacteria bacterium]|nr:hypothetical protein [Candidatus Melainabacteria bacterium]
MSPESLVPAPHAIQLISMGYDQLFADCYWLSFIGYVGDSANRTKDRYALADRYLDLVTGLDPYMVNSYWFAAFIIGSEMKQPHRAAELIERGIRANQDNWYLPFIAGVNQYLYAHDEKAAAKYYRMASKYPGAPAWLARQSDILEAEIPSTIKEINTWTTIYESATDERVAERARQKLIELWGNVIAAHPPQGIQNKAISALKDLGVDVHFYLQRFKAPSR